MAKSSTKKVAFVSSFLPRKCGIATFTSDLIENTALAARGGFEPLVVAMRTDEGNHYKEPVKFEIRKDVKSDYICAADYINFSHVDMVSIQHEFGLFGGDAGSYLTLLLKRLKTPIVTTLHTVLNNPNAAYEKSLIDVCAASNKVIVMNEHGLTMLRDIYGISGKKVQLIPHGIPDLSFVDSNYYKHKFGIEGRRTILTFGLLNQNKGIEVMLRAMPDIVKADPSVLYIILGMTHPVVLEREGESYRLGLQRMVNELGLQDNVIFHNRFVGGSELHNFLCAADIYVTSYLNKEQLTSGTLSFAVGTGKAVVSTPYWAAEELLADGRGKLVPFGDSKQMAQEIISILKDDSLFYSLRRRAYDYGRSKTWPKIGQAYWKLFSAKKSRLPVSFAASKQETETIATIEVPEPSLKHIEKLTDDTGMYQHAKFTIPDRFHGYCTDDNARAVIAMVKYYAQYPQPSVRKLFDTYLSFVLHSQNSDGTIRNFMNFDRTWQEPEPFNDALGRVLWAFGTVVAKPPSPSHLSIIKDCFDKSVIHVARQSPRGMAYSILGMSDYLRQFGGASEIKRQLALAADKLVALYEKNSHPDWQWFEDIMAYDNAVLPHALFAAYLTLKDERYLEVAEKTCEFLLETTFNSRHFSFIGCKGWYRRGKTKANFDQQPLEAASTVMMLSAAYQATQDKKFAALQRRAFDWFLGENDLQIPLYDFRSKGCNDGLSADGVNVNQGAESTLSFMLSLLTIVESYAIVDKVSENEAEQTDSGRANARPLQIKDIPSKDRYKKAEIEEFA
ncbi:MAG: glycosyltransferase [Planctomycetes bacterium]|nr:glycosyltransferase [Planctomycetota bacterium]